MKKVIVNENERGLMYRNGKFVRVLDPGKYYTFGDTAVDIKHVYNEIFPHQLAGNHLLTNEDFASRVLMIDVEENCLALVYRSGIFVAVLRSGRHLYWNEDGSLTYRMIDLSSPDVPSDLAPGMLEKLAENYRVCKMTEITEYQKGLLFVNRQYVRMLEPGVYYFWSIGPQVNIRTVDTRLLQMDIHGQEILTKDKVTLRINLVCRYRIRDYERILLEVDDYEEQLRLAAQMALREYVGRMGLDEILDNREKIGAVLLEQLKKKEDVLCLTVTDAGVKDIILPGEVRDIMNTVLIAEKRAQANVITRREEVASTRSLLNTARLMEENKTLYKLKELEYLEKICEHVGSIHLGGSNDVLSQLTTLLQSKGGTA